LVQTLNSKGRNHSFQLSITVRL